jgi:hypothetical protein
MTPHLSRLFSEEAAGEGVSSPLPPRLTITHISLWVRGQGRDVVY